ncbi:acetaldehyde dehydrogenase (acetylating) [Planococcus shenhongbingii]|uniref:Acetaldehyde dehydrogenase n=1 Tax=Planococcus shenhongbingii TaxID=3058398 RepID=A0ABT8NEM3_9BACL|nr:acetaldehyde dehydrogenase (acetylating) [Planococcus sp. N017]MDN7246354.1 acetaldehyde dehydrogenase (acetylating) [Planococcus sp. N017]
MEKIKVAILGSGNIGTDLMYKILKTDGSMELALMAGIDPESEGLKRAGELQIPTTARGIDGILEDRGIRIVFDATSAKAHLAHAPRLKKAGIIAVDLTPAAVGPYVVPAINLGDHLEVDNVNMISCSGQATTPLVYAVNRIAPVKYSEIIATISSDSVGPGTRQNLDEFTLTTANACQKIGGAETARAIPIINSAEPPIIMNNTVYAVLEKEGDEAAILDSINEVVAEVQRYVPGYRLKSKPYLDIRHTPWGDLPIVIILNEVEGAGDFFPAHAGNLDIMTAAAQQVGEQFASHLLKKGGVIV